MNAARVAMVVAFGIALNTLPVRSQGNADREAIVFFGRDAVALPLAQNPASLQEVEFADPSLEAAMIQWGVQGLRRCFPGCVPADTLKVSRLGNVVAVPDFSRVYVLTLEHASNVDSLVMTLASRSDVLIAEKNVVEPPDQCPVVPPQACPPVLEPNDEYFRFFTEWHLYNCSSPGRDVGAVLAWALSRGSPNVTIAIVDNGIDADHEEFVGKIGGDTQIDPAYPNHGTAVASMASANTNNGCGVASLNWHARINAQHSTVASDSRDAAILDAINAGADVINMSFGSYVYSELKHSLMATAYKLDMVPVASAGNDMLSDMHYPSAFYEVMSVAATNNEDERASFSNFGKIDVAAPGEQLWVALSNNDYGINSGTSFASPLVASLAALVLAEEPTLWVEDVMGIIRSSAEDVNQLTDPGTDQYLGDGRINARAALDRLSRPWALEHLAAFGATTVQAVGNEHLHKFFISPPGLANGTFRVQRIEYERTVSFSSLYANTPDVWGLKTTTGYYPTFNVTFDVGWAEAVPGTITRTGCTLRTYAYDVWSAGGAYLGTFPESPQEVTFAYAVLGLEDLASPSVLGVMPSGGELLQAGQSATIQWHVTDEYLAGVRCTILLDLTIGGNTTVWQVAQNQTVDEDGNGSLNWSIPGGQPGGSTYRIRVIAYDTNDHQGGDASDAYFTINPYSGKGGSPPPPDPCEAPCPTLGRSPFYLTDLLPASPNPFNPQTQLRFTLAEPDEISLRVYDVQGRLVTTVVEGIQPQGIHEIPWDGADSSGNSLPSGVYFVVLSADRRVFTQKLVILR